MKGKLRIKVVLLDSVLIAVAFLLVQFLCIAFSGQRSSTGTLLGTAEILSRLWYVVSLAAGLLLASVWNAGERWLGATPARALLAHLPADEVGLPWHRTLRGWFLAVLAELTFFTGWVVTEVNLHDLVTQFSKAAGIVSGLMHPSSAVLGEGVALLVETVFLAFMATAFAVPVAGVLSFAAARNLTRSNSVARAAYVVVRVLVNFARAVEPLVWALIFISWVGIGPFAGVLALWVHSVAALTKLYSEQIEAIDPGPMEAITATGANWVQVLRFGVLPQVTPPFLSFTIYRWDINVRMSTIIGFVGGGGIGYVLKPRVDLGQWGEVATLVLLIAGTVWLMDLVSARLREKLV